MLMEHLDLEIGGIPVEYGHPPAVPTQRVGREDAVSRRRVCENPTVELTLEDP